MSDSAKTLDIGNMFENFTTGHLYSRGAYSTLGPHRQSIGYRNFDQVGTNNAMTHVMVVCARVGGTND